MSVLKIVIVLTSFLTTTAIVFFTSNIITASLIGLILLQFIDDSGITLPNVFSIFTNNVTTFLKEPEAFKLFTSMMLLSGTLELLIDQDIIEFFIQFWFPFLGTGVYLDLLLSVFALIFSCDDTILLLWLSSIFKSAILEKESNYKRKLNRKIIITDGLTNTIPWLMPFSSEAAYLIYCIKDASGSHAIKEHSKTYLRSILSMFYPVYYLVNLLIGIVIEIIINFSNEKHDNKSVNIYNNKNNKFTNKQKLVCNLSVFSFSVIIWTGYFMNGYCNLDSNVTIKNGFLQYIYAVLWSVDSADALFNSSLVCFIFNYSLISWYSTKDNKDEVCKRGVDDMLEIIIITLLANCFSQRIKELGIINDLEYALKKYNIKDFIIVPIIYIVSIIITILVGNSWFTIKILIDLMIKRICSNDYILGSIVSGAAFGDKITLLSESRAYFSTSFKIKVKKLTKQQGTKCWFIGLVAFVFGHLALCYLSLCVIYMSGIIFIFFIQILKRYIIKSKEPVNKLTK